MYIIDIMDKNGLKDKVYEKFIKYACQKSDAVMFLSSKRGFGEKDIKILENTTAQLKTKYKESFLKSKNVSSWVGTSIGITRKEKKEAEKLNEILFFRPSKEIKEYLLSNKNIYTWLNPKYPEDVAFFKDGYCWFYSVTHEEFCFIYCDTKEEYEYIRSMGIKPMDEENIFFNNCELYYEDYLE